MRFEHDRFLEEDDDLWDDELELTADDGRPSLPPQEKNAFLEEPRPEPQLPEEPEPEEPEPEPEPEPRRSGFFRRRRHDDDEEEEEDNDYYDSDHEPEPRRRPKAPKTPKLDPEDPDYWISDSDDDSPLSGLMPNPGKPWIWRLIAAIALCLALAAGWIWLFRPYSDSAVKYGYIRNMERRGSIIKTFEGTMIPYKEIGDPDPLYFQQLHFSVPTDSLATLMKRMMLGCVPIRVEYETYNLPLPWKGESRIVVVKADTADTRKILPPEYRR